MARQQSLPGVGPKRIAEIEDAALKLRTVRTKRQKIAAEEEEAQQELRDVLKKNGFRKGRIYQFENEGDGELVKLDVVLEQKEERAYVRKHKDDTAADDSDEKAEEGGDDTEP